MNCPYLCIPGGARTLDPLIKSQLLYQLSYGYIPLLFATAIIVQAERISRLSHLRLQSYNFFLICVSKKVIFFYLFYN